MNELIAYLERTRAELSSLADGLSEATASRVVEEGKWSIAEHTEHLATTERGILLRLKRGGGGDLAATVGKDTLIRERVAVALQRIEAPEPVRPQGRYGPWPGPLKAFQEARASTLAFAASSPAELIENCVSPHPVLGDLNGRQWLLFLAAHTERHIKHMRDGLAKTA